MKIFFFYTSSLCISLLHHPLPLCISSSLPFSFFSSPFFLVSFIITSPFFDIPYLYLTSSLSFFFFLYFLSFLTKFFFYFPHFTLHFFSISFPHTSLIPHLFSFIQPPVFFRNTLYHLLASFPIFSCCLTSTFMSLIFLITNS